MHIYPYEDRSRDFPRRDERMWRLINKIVGAIHVAGYITCFVLTSIGVNQIQTAQPWITTSPGLPRYQDWAEGRLVNCTTQYAWGDSMISGVVSTIDHGVVGLLTADYYYLLRRLMIINGLALGVSIVNKVFFACNLYFLKLRYFVFRKDTVSMLEVVFLLAAFGTVADQESVRAPLNRHLQYCINDKTYDVQQFTFTTSFVMIPLWIALGVATAAIVVQMLLFVYHAVTDVAPPPTKPHRFFAGHATTTEPLPDAKILEPPAEMREILRKKRSGAARRRVVTVDEGRSGAISGDATAVEDKGTVASPDLVLPAGRSKRRRRAAGSPKRDLLASGSIAGGDASLPSAGSPAVASISLGGFAVPQTHGLGVLGFDNAAADAFAQAVSAADADGNIDAPDELGESAM